MRRNILLVGNGEEEFTFFDHVIKAMRVHFFTCSCANSALAAMELMKHHKPDYIFVDHTMPYITGTELLTMLRSVEEYAGIKKILMSSSLNSLIEAKARVAGADEVIKKPDSQEGFIEML